MSDFAKEDTILIVNVTEYEPIQRAWNECKKMGLVEELEVRTESGFVWTRGRYLKQ